MAEGAPTTKRISSWWMGGAGAMGAASCTHPLDLIKVHLQTQHEGRLGMLQMGVRVVKSEGIFGLYAGLSASLLRQATYSTTRFAIYETVKKEIQPADGNLAFHQKVLLAAISGFCGGIVGTPADMVNVRMQNDVKLPVDQRRNYKHAVDGLFRVWKEEGSRALFNGVSMATTRGIMVTIGQLSFYDQFKQMLLASGKFKDNEITHFTSSFGAGTCATLLSQPIDVFKTRLMNAKPGEFNSLGALIKFTAQSGISGFYKGFIPAWIRLGPYTILTFMFFEQLRLKFGKEVAI